MKSFLVSIIVASIFIGITSDIMIVFCVWAITGGDRSGEMFFGLAVFIGMAMLSAVLGALTWSYVRIRIKKPLLPIEIIEKEK